MFCSKCGKEIEENAKFCQHCGYEIGSSKFNNKTISIIAFVVFLIVGCFFITNISKNNNDTVITIKNGKSLIDNAFDANPNFVGSKVLVKIKSPSLFKPVNKKVMNALEYKFGRNLYNTNHADATILQVASDKFLIYIPNEFDKKEIEKLLNTKPMLEFKRHPNNNENIWESTGITGLDLKSSSVDKGYDGRWVVTLNFKPEGKVKFAKLTTQLIDKPLAIFFDNELQSAPIIKEAITGGSAQISGGVDGFTYEEATMMTNVLNAEAASYKIQIEDIK